MLLLSRFGDLQDDGLVANCEIDGKVKYSIPSESDTVLSKFIPFITDLPNVHFHDGSRGNISAKYTAASSKELFLSVEDTKWMKIKTEWLEHGFLSAFAVVLESFIVNKLNPIEGFIQSVQGFFRKYFNKTQIKGNEDVILPDFCECKHWKLGMYRTIKWHPHCNKLSVVTANDDVRIYCAGAGGPSVLKHRSQQYITCVEWKPLSASELAVGCSRGIFIWNIEPNSIVTRPSITCATLLSKPGHTYISSISWNKQGNLLVSSSICDRTMYVWDVSMEVAVPLQKFGGGIPIQVHWSPTSEYVFAGTTNMLFRIWSCKSWTSENWFTGSTRVRCACWSPDGSVLLFTTMDEPFIYGITVSSDFNLFSGSGSASAETNAVCIADLTRHELPSGDIIGGPILQINWDPSGKMLAVIFKDSNLIPVFNTIICAQPKILQLTPRCLIRGRIHEIPNCVDFQKNIKNGANLAISWSSGRIQYFPFYSLDPGTVV